MPVAPYTEVLPAVKSAGALDLSVMPTAEALAAEAAAYRRVLPRGSVAPMVEGAAAAPAVEYTSGPLASTRAPSVTEAIVREAMIGAPLKSQQAGGVSMPRIQAYVEKIAAGEVAPAIQVDGEMIVDGNHRYIAGRIMGQEPTIQPWAGGRPGRAVDWQTIPIDPEPWQ